MDVNPSSPHRPALSRRAFIRGALFVGVALPTVGGLLSACTSAAPAAPTSALPPTPVPSPAPSARRYPNVIVRVIDLVKLDGGPPPDPVVAVPTYLLNGRVVSLGNSYPEELFARLLEAVE